METGNSIDTGIISMATSMMTDSLNNFDCTDNFFAYAFRLSDSGTTVTIRGMGEG